MFKNFNTIESNIDKTIRATFYLQLVNELENAETTLKEGHDIYDLYIYNGSEGQKRHFCTFDFYTEFLELEEFEMLIKECKDLNERARIF